MATATETAPPTITVFQRVISIPMISSSISTLNDTLTSNAYTRSPYTTAKGLSNTAYKYTEPLQIRLAPLIEKADGIANKAVDVVESRYPYPFKAKPEDVAQLVRERKESMENYVRERRESAVIVANKTIDEKVKSPVVNVATGIDQRFAPIVDYFEVAVTRLNGESEPGPSNPNTNYQYQRALALSKSLTNHFYEYSNEQIKQLQTHNALVRRATETAQSITSLASSSLASAQSRVYALSDNMLVELQKLQSSTVALSSSLSNSLSSSVSSISSAQTAALNELSAALSGTVQDLKTIMAEDIPMNEKVTKVTGEVKHRVTPLLERVSARASEVLEHVKHAAGKAKEEVKPNGSGNGHVNGET